MRRFRSLAAYEIHCSPNTGEFEALVQIQFGLLELELLTKWISATLLSQAAYCSPRLLHTTSSFNHCWVPVSWIICVSAAATHRRYKTHTHKNWGSAESSASNDVWSKQNITELSTCVSKTKAAHMFIYFRCRSSYGQLKNVHSVLALIITRHWLRWTQSPDSFTVESREKTPWWERTTLGCCCSPPIELRRQPVRKQCGSGGWSSKQTLTVMPAIFATRVEMLHVIRLPPQGPDFCWQLMCS